MIALLCGPWGAQTRSSCKIRTISERDRVCVPNERLLAVAEDGLDPISLTINARPGSCWIVLPDWAFTQPTNALSIRHVCGRSLRARNVCANFTSWGQTVAKAVALNSLAKVGELLGRSLDVHAKLAVAELPYVSVAVQLTVVVPIPNVLPEARTQASSVPPEETPIALAIVRGATCPSTVGPSARYEELLATHLL